MTTYLGKSCLFCLPRVPFVNCRQFMYLVISLLVLRAGYGIWLYQFLQFLIIAYLFSSWNAQMLHFPLCRESVLGMPRIEKEFEFDMVFCFWHTFGTICCLFLFFFFFFTRIYLQHIARPVESDRPINIVFLRLSVRSFVVSLWK